MIPKSGYRFSEKIMLRSSEHDRRPAWREADVAFVEAVSGRVVVFARGKPALLENSDIISDHAQLDLQADSELRFCHFKANRLLMLRGPIRAFVSADGVTDERGRTVDAVVGTCTPPAR